MYLKFKDSPEVDECLGGPFRRTVCKVNDKEFEKAKGFADYVVLSEFALDR